VDAAHGEIDLKPFITERVGLDEAPGVFRRIDEGLDHIKVMIEFGKDQDSSRS
jgi:threonine dehydrogenase-like Zn-dependent dehydrogenase